MPDEASFAAYLHSGHVALVPELDAELHAQEVHRRALDTPAESGTDAAPEAPFVAHHLSGPREREGLLARVGADMSSRPWVADVRSAPDPGSAEQWSEERFPAVTLQDEEIQQQFDDRLRLAQATASLAPDPADRPPIFDLTPDPPRRLVLQAVVAGEVESPYRADSADVPELKSTQSTVAAISLEVDPAAPPVLPWWKPRSASVEVPGLPGLVAARQDRHLLAAYAPSALIPVAVAMVATEDPDFVYRGFEWDEEFGFNPWNPGRQGVVSGVGSR